MLNYSEASERNKQPIFNRLVPYLTADTRVLEIGSGSGQHALFIASQLPQISWQPSEQAQYVEALALNIEQLATDNIEKPLTLDVREKWPTQRFNAIYSANTLHIMSWQSVQAFFVGASRGIAPCGYLFVYGPFRYQSKFTAPSNRAFDQMLRERDPQSGIRDFEAVNALADKAGFSLVADYEMPANNQLVIWQHSLITKPA